LIAEKFRFLIKMPDLKRKKLFLLLFFLALGLTLRLNHLAGRSLWTDEFFTFFQSSGHGEIQGFLNSISRQMPPKVFKVKEFKAMLKNDGRKNIQDVNNGLIKEDTHPPFYFWTMYFWMRLFGDSVFAVRLFSVSMGLFSIPLAYVVTRHLFNEKAAICAALFVSISPFAVRYSQEARAYTLIMVLGLLSWLFLLRLEKQNKNFDAFGFTIFNSLGIYTHYFYIFISFAQFLYFTITHRKDSRLLDKFYLSFLSSLLFLLPWAEFVVLKGYNFLLVEWPFGRPGIIDKVYNLFVGNSRYILMFDARLIFLQILVSVSLILFLFISVAIFKDVIAKYLRNFIFCLTIFLVPLLSMFGVDIIQHSVLLKQERFWMFSFLGFIPLAGYFLSYLFLKRKLIFYLVIWLMLVSSFSVSNLQFGPAPKDVSAWINQESGGRRAAVVVWNVRSVVVAQSYYLDGELYLIPVSDEGQFRSGIKEAYPYVEKLFLVRHFHRDDPGLMDKGAMEIKDAGLGFCLEKNISRNEISVAEYVKCKL